MYYDKIVFGGYWFWKKLIYSSVFLVLKEVGITALYVCVCVCTIGTMYKKATNGCIYKFRKKSIHCTGYPLIQVEIVSVCKKSLHALAGLPKFSVDFSLLLECGCS